ncbi:MAG TPA: polysaccharide pyruvyl transferase CsaB [Symbiobacteriaceae bacterium]|jgi:polysaccharide pyruvyl transferase CsaB
MANILVSGYYGFNNAGDEAILAGLIRAIRELEPETNFTVISGTAARTRAEHGVSAVSRGDFKKIWKAMAEADLVISGGGSLLQDVTSTKSLVYYLGVMTLAMMRHRPVMVYAQGIGPVTGLVGRTLIPTVVNGVSQITVRDQESLETLRHLGVFHPPAMVTADPALALGPADPDWGAALLKEQGVDLARPILGVSIRPWKLGEQPVEPELAKALDELAGEGLQVVFIPMQLPRDIQAATEVARLMTQPAEILQGDYTYAHAHAMIARCDAMIGMRYHALVFAAMDGIPLAGLSYDPKTDSWLKLVGETPAGTTNNLTGRALARAVRRALAEAPAFRQRLLHKMAELTPLAKKNAELAVNLIKRSGHK